MMVRHETSRLGGGAVGCDCCGAAGLGVVGGCVL